MSLSYADGLLAIGAILGAGSVDYAIVPIGVPSSMMPGGVAGENPAHTTVTTYGQGAGSGLVFTYSSARHLWVGPQVYRRNILRSVKFDGPTNYLEAPDANFWSLLAGVGDDGPCSFGVRVNIASNPASPYLFNKYGVTAEYRLLLGSPATNRFGIYFFDGANGVEVNRETNVTSPLGQDIEIGFTSAGTGGATAMNGVVLYANGVAVASTATNNAAYVSMVNTVAVPAIGRRSGSASGGFIDRFITAPGLWLTKRQLTAAEMWQVYWIGLGMQKGQPFLRRLARR